MKKNLFKEAKKTKTGYKNRSRMLVVFFIMVLCFAALALRLGWHMVIKGEEYAAKAMKQQTDDSVVTAVRGEIEDSNGNALAVSASTNTIWVRPKTVKANGKTTEEIEKNLSEEIQTITDILGMERSDVYDILTSDKTLVRLAKHVDDEKADALRKADLAGLEIVDDVMRYYPMSRFACQLVGLTNDDGDGMTGLELYYDRFLSGMNGRWISSKDRSGNSLVYGTNKYYGTEDGYTIVTTLDMNVQNIVEEVSKKWLKQSESDRVSIIVMDPNTGDILAATQTDEFDPNDPRAPRAGDEEKFAKMTDAEKVAYWNKMWRSFLFCDVYEPGSTFKLVTTAIALDSGAITKNDSFYCGAYTKVADRIIKCWYYPGGHGTQSLAKAVGNSCNMALVDIAQRMGKNTFYNGIEAFGLNRKTGVDYPGEAENMIYTRAQANIVEISTMSFGQGIALTPVSLVTAVSALANGGYLLEPHLVKEIRDADDKVVESFGRTVKSVPITAQTAQEMLDIMEYVVSEGGAGKARISGYRIGGKTGTANKPVAGGYSSDRDVFASFIGVAPIDDPKMVVLVICDTPKVKNNQGSNTAAPAAKEVMEAVLKYMNIQPHYTDAELKKLNSKLTTVPDLTGDDMEDVIGRLAGKHLNYNLSPALEDPNSVKLVVTDQYPKPGTEVSKESTVTVYYEILTEEEEEHETH
ncbi:MAG: PASTA domain-containing protein [Firmicutes bacterium]|nr:PASTA domain-containing protein [Bacillota bacterium]